MTAEIWLTGLLRATAFLTIAGLVTGLSIRTLRIKVPQVEQWAWFIVLLQGLFIVPASIPLPHAWISLSSTSRTSLPLSAKVPSVDRPQSSNIVATTSTVVESTGDLVGLSPEIDPVLTSHVTARSIQRSFTWKQAAMCVWLFGLLGISFYRAYRYQQFVAALRDARRPSAEFEAELQAVLEEGNYGFRTKVDFAMTDEIGPAVCRLLGRTLVVIPEPLWLELNSAERWAVLRHEIEHLRRRDLWWSLLARGLAAIHWFNPCARWAVLNFERQGEFACDAAVGDDGRLLLAELLMRLGAAHRRHPGVGMFSTNGQIYDRIERLIRGSLQNHRRRSTVPLIIASCFAVAALVRFDSTRSTVFGNDDSIASTPAAPLPKHALLRLGTESFAMADFATDIAFAPDSQHIAAAEANSPFYVVRIFDVGTGREVAKLSDVEGTNGWIACIAISPDGSRLVGGSASGNLIVWDIKQRSVLHREQISDRSLVDLCYSPNGQFLAIFAASGQLQLRSAANPGQVIHELQSGPSKASSGEGALGNNGALAFSREGADLICAHQSSNVASVWNVSSGQLRYTFNPLDTSDSFLSEGVDVSITPDGKSILTSGHRTVPRNATTLAFGPRMVRAPQVRLWNLETGVLHRDLSDLHEYGPGFAAIRPEGQQLIELLYDELVVKDLANLNVQKRFPLNGEWARVLRLSPDGKWMALSIRSQLSVLALGPDERPDADGRLEASNATSAAWSTRGDRIATAHHDGQVRLWDTSTGDLKWCRPLAPYIHPTGRRSRPSFVAINNNWQQAIAAGVRDDAELHDCGVVTFFDLESGQVRGDVRLRSPIRVGAIAPNGRVAVFAGNHGGLGETKLYGVDIMTRRTTFVIPSDEPRSGLYDVKAIQFLPDSSAFRVATADSQIIEFEAENGKQRNVVSIDWRTDEQRKSNKPKVAYVWEASFTPDASVLVSSQEQFVYVWNANTGTQELKLSHPHQHGCRLSISPDRQTIVTSDVMYAGDYGDNTIRFFSTLGKKLATLNPGDARANVFAFSADGHRLLTGFFGQSPIIWDVDRALSNDE